MFTMPSLKEEVKPVGKGCTFEGWRVESVAWCSQHIVASELK